MTAAFRADREARKRRHRRIILNNDGNEPVYLIEAPTEEELLKYRTVPWPDRRSTPCSMRPGAQASRCSRT